MSSRGKSKGQEQVNEPPKSAHPRRGGRTRKVTNKAKDCSDFVYGQKNVDMCIKEMTEADKPLKKRATATINGDSPEGEERQNILSEAMAQLGFPDTNLNTNVDAASSNNASQEKVVSVGGVETTEGEGTQFDPESTDTNNRGLKRKRLMVGEESNLGSTVSSEIATKTDEMLLEDKITHTDESASKELSETDTVTKSNKSQTVSEAVLSHDEQTHSTNNTFPSHTQERNSQQNGDMQVNSTINEIGKSTPQIVNIEHQQTPQQTLYSQQSSSNASVEHADSHSQQFQIPQYQYNSSNNMHQQHSQYMYQPHNNQNSRMQFDQTMPPDFCNSGFPRQNYTNTSIRFPNTSSFGGNESYGLDNCYSGNYHQNRHFDPRMQHFNNVARMNYPERYDNYRPPDNLGRQEDRSVRFETDTRLNMANMKQPLQLQGGNEFSMRHRLPVHSHNSGQRQFDSAFVSDTTIQGSQDNLSRDNIRSQSSFNKQNAGNSNIKSFTGRFVNITELHDPKSDTHFTTNSQSTCEGNAQSHKVPLSSSVGDTAVHVSAAQDNNHDVFGSPEIARSDHTTYMGESTALNGPELNILDIPELEALDTSALADDFMKSVDGDQSLDKNLSVDCSGEKNGLRSGGDIIASGSSKGAVSSKRKKLASRKNNSPGTRVKKRQARDKTKSCQKNKSSAPQRKSTRSPSPNGSNDYGDKNEDVSESSTEDVAKKHGDMMDDVKLMVVRVKEGTEVPSDDMKEQLATNTKNIELLTRMIEGLHIIMQDNLTSDQRTKHKENIVWSVQRLIGLTSRDSPRLARLKVIIRALYSTMELVGHSAMGKGKSKPALVKDSRWPMLKACAKKLNVPEGKHVDAVNTVCRQKTREFRGDKKTEEDEYSSEEEDWEDDNDEEED